MIKSKSRILAKRLTFEHHKSRPKKTARTDSKNVPVHPDLIAPEYQKDNCRHNHSRDHKNPFH